MDNPEKELEQIYEEFGKACAKVADDAISDMVTKYIPYAETDFYTNVEMRTRDWIEAFFDGEKDEWIDNPMLNEYHCKKAREKVYQEHKEEIVKLIGEDKDKEIERLKDQMQFLQESKY